MRQPHSVPLLPSRAVIAPRVRRRDRVRRTVGDMNTTDGHRRSAARRRRRRRAAIRMDGADPVVIIERPSRVALLISLTLSSMRLSAMPGCVLIWRIY